MLRKILHSTHWTQYENLTLSHCVYTEQPISTEHWTAYMLGSLVGWSRIVWLLLHLFILFKFSLLLLLLLLVVVFACCLCLCLCPRLMFPFHSLFTIIVFVCEFFSLVFLYNAAISLPYYLWVYFVDPLTSTLFFESDEMENNCACWQPKERKMKETRKKQVATTKVK